MRIYNIKAMAHVLAVAINEDGGRKWPFPITLASGLYNSLYYRTRYKPWWWFDV